MSKAEEIMDAAEGHIRRAGFNGFSFRDLAAEVGVKSASVHHHFPTKASLGAAVPRRYADRFLGSVEHEPDDRMVIAWRTAFRRALREDGRMCLCGVLGAEVGGIPPEVAIEARLFFERGVAVLARAYGEPGPNSLEAGMRTLATLEGAMLIARVLNDPNVFDGITSNLI